MRGLWDQDQVMSASMIRSATLLLGALLAAIAAISVLGALGSLFSGRFFTFLVQIAGGLGIPLAIWLIVRLLSEGVMAQHRLSDRLTILTDVLNEQRTAATAEPAKPAAKRVAKASKAKTEDAKTDAPDASEDA
ncbi:MAG: hypothetical protein AAGB25_01070 [Pseudomonadota bacterium]